VTALRIGIDLRVLDAPTPGQQRYLWRLGHSLAARGHEVVFTTARHSPAQIAAATASAVRIESLAGLSTREVAQRIAGLKLDILLANPERSRHFRRVRPNLLRSAYGTQQYSQKLRSFRHPLSQLLRRIWRSNPWLGLQRAWERRFYEDTAPAPWVIAQSNYMRRQITDSYRVPEDRVQVIYNAVDLEAFNPHRRQTLRSDELRQQLGISPQAFAFLVVAHNYRLKGLWQVLEHIAALRRAGIPAHLLVAGRGTGNAQRRQADRQIQRLGLQAHVTRVGGVSDPVQLYAAADALVHLTWHDSFGFVVLEAMACGLPVITTPWAGASELVEPGVSGFIVDPARPSDVRDALLQMTREATADRFGAAAAARALEHGEPENFVQVETLMRTAAEDTSVAVRL
jgi:glycosyltransferase involved in cell wall biosynthesis